MKGIVLAALLPLCACAAWPKGSYVQMGGDHDAAVLAPAIASYVTGAVPAGTAGDVVTLVPAEQADDALTPMLRADLRADGVMVGLGGVPVSYLVAPLDKGVLLRVTLGSSAASQFFARATDGSLQPGGPMMVVKQ